MHRLKTLNVLAKQIKLKEEKGRKNKEMNQDHETLDIKMIKRRRVPKRKNRLGDMTQKKNILK